MVEVSCIVNGSPATIVDKIRGTSVLHQCFHINHVIVFNSLLVKKLPTTQMQVEGPGMWDA